jgi:chorismate mutase-like protein
MTRFVLIPTLALALASSAPPQSAASAGQTPAGPSHGGASGKAHAAPDNVLAASNKTNDGPGQALADCRRRIDAVDARMVALLNERARIVQEVGRIKQQMHAPVTAPKRVDAVLRKVAERNPGPLPNDAVQRIYREIIQEMTAFEQTEMPRETGHPPR